MKKSIIISISIFICSTNLVGMHSVSENNAARGHVSAPSESGKEAKCAMQIVSVDEQKSCCLVALDKALWVKVVAGNAPGLIGCLLKVLDRWPAYIISPYASSFFFNPRDVNTIESYLSLTPPSDGTAYYCAQGNDYYLLHESWLEGFEPVIAHVIKGPYKEFIGKKVLLAGTTEEFFGNNDEPLDYLKKYRSTYKTTFEQYKALHEPDSFAFSAEYAKYANTQGILHHGKSIFYGIISGGTQERCCLHEDWLEFESAGKKQALIALSHKIGERLIRMHEVMKKLETNYKHTFQPLYFS
jgi:hypothetical protein